MVVCATEILQEQSLIIILIRGIGQANGINLTQRILLIIGLRFKMQQLMFICILYNESVLELNLISILPQSLRSIRP